MSGQASSNTLRAKLVSKLSNTLNLLPKQVDATLALFEQDATVPFIARYRKEATGGLSDDVLRELHQQKIYLTELFERQQVILHAIEAQGKLTDTLKQTILSAETKTRLEDLYLPYKPKRTTKAELAKNAGLLPLAEQLLTDLTLDPEQVAKNYLNPELNFPDAASVLLGVRYILAEQFAEHADLLARLRDQYQQHALITSTVRADKAAVGEKFNDYFEFSEAISHIPSHRLLAIFRGQKLEILQLQLQFPQEAQLLSCYELIAQYFQPELINEANQTHWLWQTIHWSWQVKLKAKLDLEFMVSLKQQADAEAINVFSDNLKNLLLAAPAGNHVVLGLDPGYRTGVKTVVIDGTGKLLAHTVIYPHQPQKQWDQALLQLTTLCQTHQVALVAIGNGTASRETDQLVAELIKQQPKLGLTKIVVSEAGASVYSASALASKEFPELDVSFRGAVSIARRLQDPLAELVKIDPKAIGVGQYQHDVNQVKLEQALTTVLEDCVNAVGADINTASVPLLKSISGLNETTAMNIVQYREAHGRFIDRESIKQVPRLGEKTFQQAAGFLRIIDGKNYLDRSAVHPESYPIVQAMAIAANTALSDLVHNHELINQLDPEQFVTDSIGLPTIHDIFSELKKPGRDPRPAFTMAKFSDAVTTVTDLKPGMILEGVVTNVANFGAFVDIGVHQDGLVHISQLADTFVKDVHQVIQVGQIVKVKVLEVDITRQRISLSMKLNQTVSNNNKKNKCTKSNRSAKKLDNKPPVHQSALAEQLKALL